MGDYTIAWTRACEIAPALGLRFSDDCIEDGQSFRIRIRRRSPVHFDVIVYHKNFVLDEPSSQLKPRRPGKRERRRTLPPSIVNTF